MLFAVSLLISVYSYGQGLSANFTASPISGCSPLIVTFQDLSTGSPVAWSWDFGNGNTSALQNPSTTYFLPGTYTVRLTITNAGGSTNTLVRDQYITVYDVPNVNFSASSQNGCFPFHVQFTDLSTPGAGNTNVSWQWDFGNGVTSTLQNPFITYTVAGSYAVTLRVTNDKGCTKIISRPNYIIVTPGVITGFTNSQATVCSAPANITFTNTSTGPGTLSYLWNFGDGNTSILQNPVHTYTSNGTFNVTLITTSSSGCEDTARRTVTVGGFATSFNGPTTICANETAAFTNTSTPAPVSVLWDFGDGFTSTQINPTHSYTTPGNYTIWLYNTYSICTDSATSTIVVNNLPVADFNSPDTIKCAPTLLTNFQDLSTGAVGWQWDFGDGNTSTLQNPSHSYTSFGYYTVTLIVTNASGCTDTIQRPDFVKIARPIVTIPGTPARGCIPYTHSFTPVVNTLDNVTSYLWDFGDGSPASTLQNPTHTYTTQGTYTVKVFITTSTGCTDSAVVINGIRVGSEPIADFSATPIPVCAYQPVEFTDLSSTVDEWRWDFGDGTTSILQSPTHIYTDTGYFTVRLIATNNGCSDTLIRTNYIQVLPPIARFAATVNCNNRLQFSFTDQSIGAVTWSWDFGDGSPLSALQNPVHNFPALGTYTVRLTVTNGSCSHSIAHVVRTIQQSPDFFANSTTICRGDSITLAATNINPALTSSLLWRFGNGITIASGVAPVSYTYPASGTYTLTLVAIDLNGCRDSISKINYVRVNGPLANFNATNTAGCTGLITTFNDLSTTDGINSLANWRFDFGNGNVQTFTAPPFQHTFNTAGTFNVKLVVTDASGCSDSLTRPNLVTATDPVPNFTSPNTSTCPGATVSFTNTSVATSFTSRWDFGDGNTSTATSPTHNYTSTGLYTVKLIITDLYGCIDSIIRNDYIRVDTPSASFTVNDSISSCTPFEVRFTNTSTYFNSVLWNFGDGGTSTLNDPVHYYSLPGVYRVRLLVTSLGGCLDSAFINITLNDTAGSNITYTPLGGCNPLTVTLNTFTPGIISSYFWDFGDGTTFDTTGSSITHTYTSFGNFVPKVIMMDPSGCLIPITGIDTIRVVGSNPGFGFSDLLFCDSGYVTFSDSTTASDPIVSWQWNFGDGNTSSLQNPVHLYNTPGIFDVTLTIRTQSGCVNAITMPAAIKVVLSPLIDITGLTRICVHDSILHSGVFLRSDTSAVTWTWTFPNGNTSTLQNPPYQVYNTAGNFIVRAIALNSSGCTDTTTENIIVDSLPTVSMPGLITVQAGFPVTIPATYSAGVNSWTWAPATGLTCINCPTPDADPNFNTTYRVTFTDDNNCSNSDTIRVVVICQDGNLFMPNTFSPNGDGSNDVFYPRGRGLFSVRVLRIFNRWGEVVFDNRGFQVNDAAQGWDGRYKGKQASPDVYVYQVEVFCDNGDIIKLEGNVALIL